ncbi:MAG: DUF4040 domain-containing protein [Bryobacterales bacterium]|nr:DUF4040 domain-containing protein [Bryobacterales bacterium]
MAGLLALWPAALALYFGLMLRSVGVSGPIEASLPWAASIGVDLSFYADGLSLLFAVVVAGIGALIVLYGSRYFGGEPGAGRFQATLFAFMGSMLGLVLADNLFLLFVFWELTGFTSFLLIGFEHERPEARASAVQALIVTGLGGLGLLAAAVLIEQSTGAAALSSLLGRGLNLANEEFYPAIVALLLLAAFTKSAQTPFHFWLPNAMTAPTPVSAYLHSATMVKAGIYLVARATPFAGATPLWTGLVTGAGAITMIVGAWRAVAETDLKRVLAYSTVSALGLMMMLLGVGTEEAVMAALVYLLAHACYKGALFLVAGTIEHETGTRDITGLGGLRHAMPATALTGALAACSMAGLPLFLGFLGKELLYESLLAWSIALLIGAIAASALLGTAGLIAGVSPFTGPLRGRAPEHGVPAGLTVPALVLAFAGLIAGIVPGLVELPAGLASGGILRHPVDASLSIWHGFTPVLGLSLATLALVALLYVYRDSLRRRIWPRSLGSERLYTSTERGLDALSAWASPMLQSASLRSYLLVLVTTAGVLIFATLVFEGLPGWPAVMDVEPHEACAAFLIVAGAISAVRAKSSIAAVLSLGVSGYGVALTYLFFGAPDLAMTQFSVETLTAVIFVLVFYHFRDFGSLSPWTDRLRGAAVSVLFGGSIAVVLLFVGANITPFRLANYFAETGLPLAHGRNIVNVILVDFRALDTMGEITVLATAAFGVRALMRISRKERKNG